MLEKIHQKIQSKRKEFGVSQDEMAEILGITRPTYAQIELGKRELKITEFAKFIDWLLSKPMKDKKDTITKGQFYQYLCKHTKPPFEDGEFEGIWKFIKEL